MRAEFHARRKRRFLRVKIKPEKISFDFGCLLLADQARKVEHRTGEGDPLVGRAHYGLCNGYLHAERTHALDEREVLPVDDEAVDQAKVFARCAARARLASKLAHHLAR